MYECLLVVGGKWFALQVTSIRGTTQYQWTILACFKHRGDYDHRYVPGILKHSKCQNTKPLWEALNLKSKNPHSVCSSDITADVMNEHFSTVASKLCSKFVKDGFPSQVNSNQYAIKGKLLSFENFTPASICFYLKEISSNKSTGPDGISVQMLKKTLPYIVDILTDMFNRILSEGCFPSDWKLARITPIFKQGDKSNPSNYRPISILPNIIESLLKNMLMSVWRIPS